MRFSLGLDLAVEVSGALCCAIVEYFEGKLVKLNRRGFLGGCDVNHIIINYDRDR